MRMRSYHQAALALMLVSAPFPLAAQHTAHGEAAAAAAPKALTPFDRGLYLLHNFEYGSAAAAFRQAQAADPANVMAYWGEAMTFNHPLWAFQDADSARQVLAKLAPDPSMRRAKARSQREALWLDAVEALFGAGTKVDRDQAYHERMRALFEMDRGDIDARTFYALSFLGLAHHGRDIALYMRAAALLEEAIASHPDHPGLLHYMIHSYDDPDHAPLGERAASRYALVAGDAGHAQHMVSHIYLALGDWAAVEQANRKATAVVDQQRAGEGQPPTLCGHYNEWLVYALDQQGKDSTKLVDGCRMEGFRDLAGGADQSTLGRERNLFNNWANIAVRHGVDTGRWPTAAANRAGGGALLGRYMLSYGAVLAARRDAAAASAARAAMVRDLDVIRKAWPKERPDDHESLAWYEAALVQADAVVAMAAGRRDQGMALLRKVALAESALPKPFGPPVLGKPSWELLGDELLAAGDRQDAVAAYEQSLRLQPGRRLSLAGLAAARR